jgi:hypothetical protein
MRTGANRMECHMPFQGATDPLVDGSLHPTQNLIPKDVGYSPACLVNDRPFSAATSHLRNFMV